MSKFRKNLIKGKRVDGPYKSCNAEGTILGKIMQMNGLKFI